MKAALAIVSLAVLVDLTAVGEQCQHCREGLNRTQLVLDVLASARLSGSLQYNGKCGPGVILPDLPRIHEAQKPFAGKAVDTLGSMLSVDPRMVVFTDANGIVRVVETDVQTGILHVRINHLVFDRISDPEEALGIVLGAIEVQSFMQSHGIAQPFDIYAPPIYFLPGVNKSFNPGVRNISGELKDVTLGDALDYILKTFPGFWLYQNCQTGGQRVVYFDLFPAPGRIWMWEDGQTLLKQ